MAGMIKGIFGLLPAGVRAEQEKEQKDLAALMVRRDNTNPAVAKFGADFGAELGRGLLSRFGIEDPKMAEAMNAEQQQTELNEKIAALDPDDPRRQYLLAEALGKMGDTQGSLAAYASGRQMQQYQSQLAEQNRMYNLRKGEQEEIARRAQDNILAKLLETRSPEEAQRIMGQIYGGSYTSAITTDTGGPGAAWHLTGTSGSGTDNNTSDSGTNNNTGGSGVLGDMIGKGPERTINVGMDENGESVYVLVSSLTPERRREIREERARRDANNLLQDAGSAFVDYITNPDNEDRSKIF